jgi:uncharacterized protein YbaP (TraB family)
MIRALLFILLSGAALAQEVKPNYALLWEITGNNLKSPSYLFGSLHSNDKRVFDFPDSLYYALDNVESIALETDVFHFFGERELRLNKFNFLFDKNGDPYSSSGFATRTLYGDEDGMPQFLDAYFQEYCYNAGKKFEMLEPVDFQVDLLKALDNNKSSDSKLETLLASDDQLIQLYAEGDMFRLQQMLQRNLEITPGIYEKLILERNKVMTGVLDSLIKTSTVFCAVGAGHLAGNDGMINLLRKKGYTVRVVERSLSDQRTQAEIDVRAAQSYGYFNDSLLVHAVFPGKPKLDEDPIMGAVLRLVYQQLGQGNTYVLEVYPRDKALSDEDEAALYIPTPPRTNFRKIEGENSSYYYEGIADAYPEGLYWTRVLLKDQYVMVLKAFGGNKFMNSTRPFDFFDQVHYEE